LSQALTSHFKKRGFVETRLISQWDRIIGKELSGRCFPIKISTHTKHNKTSYTLVVEITDSAAAVELTYLEPIILEKIATYFGFKAIKSIKAIHRPSEQEEEPVEIVEETISKEGQEQLDSLLCDVDDEELRNSLSALGKSVWINNKQ
jgi:hypothetical protein